MKKKWRGIDLFCGIGGFRLAMKANNVQCVFSSDNDKFAQETYFANFGEVPAGDIKKIEAKDIPSFDILAAGFPCQPFSYAGEKQGFNDEIRGTLFFDICRILEYHKPPMVFLENVLMLSFWALIGTQLSHICRNAVSKSAGQNPLLPVIYMMAVVIIGILLQLLII